MSLEQSSILVVDDELTLRKVLRVALAASGFAVEEACNGEEALGTIQGHPVDLVLLDMNMPGISGIDACQKIRGISPHAGIVMVSVRDQEEDKIKALDAGADDYVTKPFKLRELTARLRAVLRRTRHEGNQPEILQVGKLKIDFQRRLLWRGDDEVHLSPIEFDLLAFMMKHPDAVLTHVKLLRTIWGPEYGGELEYLRTYVRILRKKIENDPAQPEYILTEPWVGYRFHIPSTTESRAAATDVGINSL
jgi:two-component system, OmpR family, KDP operon response regulator KdpE